MPTKTSYRTLEMSATVDATGVTVTEQWFTVEHGAEDRTQTPEGEPKRIARSANPLPEVDPEDAEEELGDAGFVVVGEWTTHPDGTLSADVDWYDPTP